LAALPVGASVTGFSRILARALSELDPSSVFSLLVVSPEGVTTHSLPGQGSVTIGRAEGNTIRVDDGSVSRQHAVLHMGPGSELRIEDLGAANGTQVQLRSRLAHGQTESLTRLHLESLRVTAGDRIVLGSVSAVVGRRAGASAPGQDASPIVRDSKMTALYSELDRAAASTINVLLLGETGVGKEVFARALHTRSRRASGPFVSINCAALPETLLEAELFGHERGAFTGATQARSGLFESADGGTLFLDEVGELPLPTQAKLLRVLEERKVVRLGGRAERPFDVRFVAATNRDLEAAAERLEFRSDLYFRFAGLVLTIPPLRERRSEIVALARAFLAQASAELDQPTLELEPDSISALERYAWPGNVRELKNAMQRAAALVRGIQIFPEHLPERVRRAPSTPVIALASAGVVPTSPAPIPTPDRADAPADDLARLRGEMRDVERARILEALDRCAGNQTRAAVELGISRRTLVKRLEEYDLPRPRKS
jgi:two-component system, NtrC family, response regulator AtoC